MELVWKEKQKQKPGETTWGNSLDRFQLSLQCQHCDLGGTELSIFMVLSDFAPSLLTFLRQV